MSDAKQKKRTVTSPFSWLKSKHSDGFTIIELLIVIFIIGTVITGLFGLFLLTMRTTQGNERRIVAVALANERMEMVRNLPYVSVGTTGGIPSGSLPQEETIERNSVPYTVKTNIVYVDDPYDGTGVDDPVNIDYKQVRIEVTWPNPNKVSPVLSITTVAPPGVEGGEAAGTFILDVLNSAGLGVADATLRLTNPNVDPPVDFTTKTNSDGRFVIPGLDESIEGYALEVSKAGHTTKKTFDETADFFPNAEHTHLTAMPGVVTEKTFFVDLVSSLSIQFNNEDGESVPDVTYRLRGSKELGLDADEETVYAVDVTQQADGTGLSNHDFLEWDDYYISIDGAATGYDIKLSDPILPFSLAASSVGNITITLVPHTPRSLHVTVVDLDGPVDGAIVDISQGEFTESLTTGPLGQVLFSDLAEEGDYDVSITSSEHITGTGIVEVDGTTRETIQLSTNE